MPTTQFLQDRKRGEVGQHYVAEMYRYWGLEVREMPRGKFDDYDILAWGNLHGHDVNFSTEVKHDYRLSDTNNFCLELDALRHSKAGILAITEGNPVHTTYILPLREARALAERWPYKKQVGERGEWAALVPREVFIESLKPKVLKAP